jgi:hypothetical protein
MFAGITVENLYLKLPQEVWDFFPLVSIQYRRSACFVLATTWAGVSTWTLFERERESRIGKQRQGTASRQTGVNGQFHSLCRSIL